MEGASPISFRMIHCGMAVLESTFRASHYGKSMGIGATISSNKRLCFGPSCTQWTHRKADVLCSTALPLNCKKPLLSPISKMQRHEFNVHSRGLDDE